MTGERLPRMPDRLNPDGKRAWRILIVALTEDGLFQAEDILALELACVAYQSACEAQRILDREGMVSFGSQGQVREHPMAAAQRASMVVFLRYLEALGVGPVVRGRLAIADYQRVDGPAEIAKRIGPSPRTVGAPGDER